MDPTIHGILDYYRAAFEDGYFYDSARDTRDEVAIFAVWMFVVLLLAAISFGLKRSGLNVCNKFMTGVVFLWTFCVSMYFPFGMVPSSPDANLLPTIIVGTLICLLISWVVAKLVSKIR